MSETCEESEVLSSLQQVSTRQQNFKKREEQMAGSERGDSLFNGESTTAVKQSPTWHKRPRKM